MSSYNKGWTLIARFSNKDNKNWMRDDGGWWYDHQLPTGITTDPSINSDMISPAFWLVSGREFKITRNVVMTPVTLLCYRLQVSVWVDKHSDQKSQVMATLEMAKFGPVTSAWEAARFNMVVSTSQQTGFNGLSAVETSKAPTASASGVTGRLVMDQ